MQSRGKLCRGASRFTPLLVIVPIHFRRHRAERVYPVPLARYTAAASIIPNYNNKCKSRITIRKLDNKVSPGARSCHSRTNATGTWYRLSFRFLVPETVTSMNRCDHYHYNKQIKSSASDCQFFFYFYACRIRLRIHVLILLQVKIGSCRLQQCGYSNR